MATAIWSCDEGGTGIGARAWTQRGPPPLEQFVAELDERTTRSQERGLEEEDHASGRETIGRRIDEAQLRLQKSGAGEGAAAKFVETMPEGDEIERSLRQAKSGHEVEFDAFDAARPGASSIEDRCAQSESLAGAVRKDDTLASLSRPEGIEEGGGYRSRAGTEVKHSARRKARERHS
jgi:hypothetical protein